MKIPEDNGSLGGPDVLETIILGISSGVCSIEEGEDADPTLTSKVVACNSASITLR